MKCDILARAQARWTVTAWTLVAHPRFRQPVRKEDGMNNSGWIGNIKPRKRLGSTPTSLASARSPWSVGNLL